MRLFQYILIFSFLILLLVLSPALEAQTIRILPFGDSTTEGVDENPPSEGQRIAYRQTLYNLLTAAGYDFDFVGHKQSGYDLLADADHGGIGGTRDQYLVRLLQDGYDVRWQQQITPSSKPYLDVYPADIILLHIGTNDITHGEGSSAGSVSQILDEIKAYEIRSGKEVIVFIARILNRKVYSSVTTEYNNNVAAMVAAKNDPDIHIVDIENGAGIFYSVDMQDDGIHPYTSGYMKMGQKWFEAILSLNTAPYFTSIPVIIASEDEPYTYNVTVADDNPMDELTLLASTLPGWLTFTYNGDKTGVLTGTPGDDDVGLSDVTLILSDSKDIVTQSFTIFVGNVNDPPVITGQLAVQTEEDTPVELTKNQLIIEDEDSEFSELSLIILPGDQYIYQGSMVTPGKDFNGNLLVNVRITDQEDESETYKMMVQVTPVNDPPKIQSQKVPLEVKQHLPLVLLPTHLNFTDIDNSASAISVVVLEDPLALYTISSNQITFVGDTIGFIDVRIKLDDGENLSDEFLMQVHVLSQYSVPEFTSTPPSEAFVDKGYFYVAQAIDLDDEDDLTYKATFLPDWLQFNASMKLLGGNPTIQDTGWVWIGLEVTDGMFVVEQLTQIEVRLPSGIGDPNISSGKTSGLIENIYPVPAGDLIHISLLSGEQLSVQIVDITGREFYRTNVDTYVYSSLELDLTNYRPGIYFVRVTDGVMSESRRIVINP